jgi:hypothetical protein
LANKLCALSDGVLDGLPLDRIDAFRLGLRSWLAEHCSEVVALDDQANGLPNDLRARLKTVLLDLARSVLASNTPPKEFCHDLARRD